MKSPCRSARNTASVRASFRKRPNELTLVQLVGAGLGVTIAPNCVRQIAIPGVACLRLRGADVSSDVELAYRSDDNRPIVKAFTSIATAAIGP